MLVYSAQLGNGRLAIVRASMREQKQPRGHKTHVPRNGEVHSYIIAVHKCISQLKRASCKQETYTNSKPTFIQRMGEVYAYASVL